MDNKKLAKVKGEIAKTKAKLADLQAQLTKFPISDAANVPTAKVVMAVALCGCWIWSGLYLMKWCRKCTSFKR